jgi:hypothetical protein
MKWTIVGFVLLVFAGFQETINAQDKSLLRVYEDSLSAAETKLVTLSKIYAQKQTALRQVTQLLQIDDLGRIEEEAHALLKNLGDDSLALVRIFETAPKVTERLAILKGKIDGAQERLLRLEQLKTRSKDLEASLVRQILKDQRELDSTKTGLLLRVRKGLSEIKRGIERDILDLGRDQDRLERLRVSLRQKIEMETHFIDMSQNILVSPPSTPSDLLSTYVLLAEAQERDTAHSYDSLFAATRRLADRFLRGVMLSRLRGSKSVIPPGRSILSTGKTFWTSGLVVSSIPFSQLDIAVHGIASGNRSKSFVQSLKSVVDLPAEEVSEEAQDGLMRRYGGRPLTGEEREYIEAGSFESVSEKRKYEVVTSLYGVNLDPRYVYVCWDEDLRDPSVQEALRANTKSVNKTRDEIIQGAVETGRVWNPKRLLIEFSPMALGYYITLTPGWSPSGLSVLGAGVVRGSFLVGFRYAINGTEATGERYGIIGVQVSYLQSFKGDYQTYGTSKITPTSEFDTKVTKLELKGLDVAIVLTLGRAFYVGGGIGQLTSEVSATLSSKTTSSFEMSQRRETTYYVFPVGILGRVGTNFAINIGGLVWWRGLFSKPSYSAGLGFNVDFPMVRFGD